MNGRSRGFNVSEDLNPQAREISPIRGNFHGSSITAGARGYQAFRVESCFPDGGDVRAGGSGALERSLGGHGPRCPQSPGRRNIRLIWLEDRCLTVQLMLATERLIGSPLRIGRPLHIHAAA